MFRTNLIGDFLVTTEYMMGRTTKPWIPRPTRTVMKYIPRWPMVDSKLFISKIFDDTRKRMPNGDNQITQLVISIISELRLWKKPKSGPTSGPSLPIAMPKAVENATRPRMFIPGTYSWVICQS